MLGHITSSYFSPNLNKSIALAVVKGGKNMMGKKLIIPMWPSFYQVKCKSIFRCYKKILFINQHLNRLFDDAKKINLKIHLSKGKII